MRGGQQEEQDRFTALPPRPALRPISGYSANGSFGQAPSLHPWTSASSHQEIAPEESRFSSFSTVQLPTPSRRRSSTLRPPSRINRKLSRASTLASVWSNSTGRSAQDDIQSSIAEFTPSTGSVQRRDSLSSLSSFQSGRVSIFRRKLSLATTVSSSARKLKTHRNSWDDLEEEEEQKRRKAEMLIRARMRRTTSKESTSTNAKTLVGEEAVKGYL